jgi:hypothetical protein
MNSHFQFPFTSSWHGAQVTLVLGAFERQLQRAARNLAMSIHIENPDFYRTDFHEIYIWDF